MNLTTLATTVFGIVTPIIKNKEVQEFSKTVWKKVKPWFIIEEKDTEELQDLKNNPEDKSAEDFFIASLKRKLDKNPELRKELEKLIADAEKNGDEQTKIIIQNSKNVVTGNISHVQGGLHIGDNIGTSEKEDNTKKI